jgi:hypothetical protein
MSTKTPLTDKAILDAAHYYEAFYPFIKGKNQPVHASFARELEIKNSELSKKLNRTTRLARQSRKKILLRAAYDMLKKCQDSNFCTTPAEETVFYDEADCDGYCLAQDILTELDLPSDTKPLKNPDE